MSDEDRLTREDDAALVAGVARGEAYAFEVLVSRLPGEAYADDRQTSEGGGAR